MGVWENGERLHWINESTNSEQVKNDSESQSAKNKEFKMR